MRRDYADIKIPESKKVTGKICFIGDLTLTHCDLDAVKIDNDKLQALYIHIGKSGMNELIIDPEFIPLLESIHNLENDLA